MAGLTNGPSQEVINLESEGVQNNNSEQELGLNESFDYEAKKIELSETITDPDFLEQALQELDELKISFNSLNRENIKVTKLSLTDLQQEFDRDIRSIELLGSNELKNILLSEDFIDLFGMDDLKALITQLDKNSKSDDTVEENFYSILNGMSINSFSSFILDFSDGFKRGESFQQPEQIEKFINSFLSINKGLIESAEITELEKLDVKNLSSNDSIEYYKQQINLLKGSVSNDIMTILDNKYTELETQYTKNIDTKENTVKASTAEVKASTAEVKASTAEVKASTAEFKASTAEVKEKNIRKFMEYYSETYDKLSSDMINNYKDVTDILKDIRDVNKNDIENIDILKSKLLTVLEKTDENGITVAEKFLQDLGKENPAMYSTLLQSFKDFSPTLAISLEKLSDPYINLEEGRGLIESDTDKLTARLGNNFTVSGNIVSTNEMYVNYNENPPQTYMKFDNGLRLNSTVEEPAILETLENEIGELGKNISMIERNIQIKEAYNKLSQDSDKNSEILSKIETEYPELMNQSVSDLQEELSNAQSELKDKKTEYSQELNLFTQACETQDVKTKEIGEFLQGIGFNLIPPSITTNLLQQLNTSGFDGLRNRMGFNRKIDLDGGVLGYENSFDNKNITLTEKVIFAEFMNRMISGDIGEPLNIDNVRTGGGEPFEDRGEFQTVLEKSGLKDSGTGISIALSNINNSFITKTTETKDKIEK